jgi:hypothetical protein
VLVGASQLTGCHGIGVDVSPDCISTATAMTKSEEALYDQGQRSCSLSSRLRWICDDCTKNTSLLRELVQEAGLKSKHVYVYLYIYPTLLKVIRAQVEEVSALMRSGEGGCILATVITAGYHFEDWSSGYDTIIAPKDDRAGPNASPVELRKLNPYTPPREILER